MVDYARASHGVGVPAAYGFLDLRARASILAKPEREPHLAKAAGWLVFLRWLVRGIGFARSLIVASLLAPEDFGRAMLLMSIVLFVEAITEIRVDFSLIRSREDRASLYDTAWTLQIIRGAVAALVIALASPALSRFYGDDQIEMPLYLLAAAVFLGSFANVSMAKFLRELDFSKAFLVGAVSRIGSLIAAVGVAIVFQSFWAIMIGYVVQRLAEVILSFLLQPQRPKLGLDDANEIVLHSKWLLLQGVLFQILLRADVFLIAKVAGPIALGPYYLAKMVSEIFGAEMSSAIRSALFSGLVKNYGPGREAADLQPEPIIRALSTVVALGAPFCVLTAVLADDLVAFALRPDWQPAAQLLQIFCVGSVFALVSSAPGAALLALGRTRLIAIRQAVGLATFLPILWFAVDTFGLQGAAFATVFSLAFAAGFSTRFALRETRGKFSSLLMPLLRIGFALTAMAVVAASVQSFIEASQERWDPFLFFRLGASGVLGLAVYASILSGIWILRGRPEDGEAAFIRALDKIVGKLRRRG